MYKMRNVFWGLIAIVLLGSLAAFLYPGFQDEKEKNELLIRAVMQHLNLGHYQPQKVDNEFSKTHLDSDLVKQKENLMTRGWRRLNEIRSLGEVSILEFPLPEIVKRMKKEQA